MFIFTFLQFSGIYASSALVSIQFGPEDKDYFMSDHSKVHSLHTISEVLIYYRKCNHSNKILGPVLFYSFCFHHPLLGKGHFRQKSLPWGEGGCVGPATCMFTLSENTSPLKEFIISNSLKDLILSGRTSPGHCFRNVRMRRR